MAVVTFLLSYIARQVNNIVQVIFGWSITALFGKLQRKPQVIVTAALVVSLVWPLFVIGAFLPGVAAWALAFLPLHHWLSDMVLRIIWIALAVAAPVLVGILVHIAAPMRKGGYARAAISGYPTALGFFAAFLVVVVTVPVLKIASIIRRWSDDHVYVQAHEGKYRAVLEQLAEAMERAGMDAEIHEAPGHMVLATTIMRTMARGTVAPFVSDTLQVVRAKGIQLYLYPADLLIRGEPKKVAHMRSMLGRTKLEAYAYLVASPDAQHVQQELADLSRRASSMGEAAKSALRRAYAEILKLDLAYDEFIILDSMARRVERQLLREGILAGSRLPIDDVQDHLKPAPMVQRPPRNASASISTSHA